MRLERTLALLHWYYLFITTYMLGSLSYPPHSSPFTNARLYYIVIDNEAALLAIELLLQ